jgi:intracellular septation protein
MKFLFDYFPIICFFVAYKLWGIYVATAVTMATSFIQICVFWLCYRRFEKLHIITFVMVMLLGGSTLIFHKDIFIKWKPTIVYWAFGLTLLGSQIFSKKTIMQHMLDEKVSLPVLIWRRLNISWGIFFLVLGFINVYVIYNFSTNTWVNFKLFGTLGIIMVFAVAQSLYMSKYMQADKELPKKKD